MNPIEPRSWREFYESHAPHYDQNPFTKNTLVECQFLSEKMKLKPKMRLLDVGCGTGRHAIELAKAGVEVTGIDISPAMLAVAREKAAEAGVNVEWIEADATAWQGPGSFDAAICLCEGGFGLVNHNEDPVTHDLNILRNISASLKPGSPFILTALNGYSIIRRVTDEHVEQQSFDPATMDMIYIDEMNLPEGPTPMLIRERLFIPPEVKSMMFHAGFEVSNIWGGTAGNWGERPLLMDEIEAMYFATKR